MEDGYLEGTLKELFETDSLKWIFVGGKGGVGKTTSSCSIAVELSKRREKVLIISTDPAHNLADAFTQKFSNTPTLVNGFDNLYAMEIDPTTQENNAFNASSNAGGLLQALPEILNSFPGIDEAMGFAELINSVQSMEYSTIVFDTAPTGHTLRLLSFPQVLEKGLKKLSEMVTKMSGAVKMISSLSNQDIDQEELFAKLDHLTAITASVRQCFQDPSRTTFVCVCIPEFLSVFETERLVQELAKQGIDASNIIVNQVLFPVYDEVNETSTIELVSDAVFEKMLISETEEKERLEKIRKRLLQYEENFITRRKMQMKYLGYIQELYAYDFHVACVPLQRNEIRGIEGLEHFGKLLQTKHELPIDQSLMD